MFEKTKMHEMVPSNLDRVRKNTDPDINRRIDAQTERNIRLYANQPPAILQARMAELEEEWDIERLLQTNASIIAFVGTLLGAFVSPWFLVIPMIVTAFLFQHAVQGWCPPLPLFRRLGKRTRSEIDAEKFALKALRGDFAVLGYDPREMADQVIQAVKSYG